MIGTIKISVNAAHPNLALQPLYAFVGSPSNLRILDVPKKIGNWRISAVYVNYNYPDNSNQTVPCVLVGGAYVCTLPACEAVGKSVLGYSVIADGVDENGEDVTGYILGKGDVIIMDAQSAVDVGVKALYVNLLPSQPANPKEGDMWPDANGGFVVWQDGEAVPLGMTQAEVADLVDGRLAGFVQRGEFGNFIAEVDDDFADVNSKLAAVNSLIPNQATSQNQLADKAFVNSSVQTATANFRGNWATWASVPSDASRYPPDYAGSRTPTVNDYMVVQDAWGFGGPETPGTWRFKYSGDWATNGKGGWLAEYQVNETPMTAAQLAALNSGITAAKVAYYDSTLSGLEELIESI